MAMRTRKHREKQEGIWIAHTKLASVPGHPFYQRLNELLEAEGFDEWLGHESLDVTLAYLKGSDAASEPVQEQGANGALAACV